MLEDEADVVKAAAARPQVGGAGHDQVTGTQGAVALSQVAEQEPGEDVRPLPTRLDLVAVQDDLQRLGVHPDGPHQGKGAFRAAAEEIRTVLSVPEIKLTHWTRPLGQRPLEDLSGTPEADGDTGAGQVGTATAAPEASRWWRGIGWR